MVTSTVRRTFTRNGHDYPLPPDVLGLMQSADGFLRGQLESLDGFEVTTEWSAEEVQPGVWDFVAVMRSDDTAYAHRFPMLDMVLPRELQQNIRWATIEFAQALSRTIRKEMRQVREEIAELVAGLSG